MFCSEEARSVICLPMVETAAKNHRYWAATTSLLVVHSQLTKAIATLSLAEHFICALKVMLSKYKTWKLEQQTFRKNNTSICIEYQSTVPSDLTIHLQHTSI